MTKAKDKELYEQTIKNSAVSWSNLYREEKKARETIEAKYNALVQEIKMQGKKRAVDDSDKFLMDYGSGPREVHHIVKKPYPPDNFEREYWAKLRELPDDI
jgi:hypothetical protein